MVNTRGNPGDAEGEDFVIPEAGSSSIAEVDIAPVKMVDINSPELNLLIQNAIALSQRQSGHDGIRYQASAGVAIPLRVGLSDANQP